MQTFEGRWLWVLTRAVREGRYDEAREIAEALRDAKTLARRERSRLIVETAD